MNPMIISWSMTTWKKCVDELHSLIACQHWQVKRNLDFISRVRGQIKEFLSFERRNRTLCCIRLILI